MKIYANAKINLSLLVTGTKENGYHLIDSLICPVSLYDEIIIHKNKIKKENIILINNRKCTFDNNVCLKLLDAFLDKYKKKDRFTINIKKHIPLSSGLGGSSTGAVAIYKYLLKKYDIKITDKEVFDFLLPFGSDMPFFYINKICRVRGIGEEVMPLDLNLSKYHILVVDIGEKISTKSVYENYKDINQDNEFIDKLINELKNDGNEIKLHNDLEKISFNLCPKIKDIKEEISKVTPLTIMTGSGSNLIVLSKDESKINKLTLELTARGLNTYYVTIPSFINVKQQPSESIKLSNVQNIK